MPTTPTIADALTSLSRLTSVDLLTRLGELHAEQEQVRVLLRAARARERAERIQQGINKGGAPRAS